MSVGGDYNGKYMVTYSDEVDVRYDTGKNPSI